MGRTKKVLSKGRNVGGIILIFVTVGTHEQGMERLLIELDRLIECDIIKDEVFAQTGYSEYKPQNYKYKCLLGYDEMSEMMEKSNIIITHGGPGSIFQAIQFGKIPIVVPRNPKYNEHVDNHQILFTKRLELESKIIGVYNIDELGNFITQYNSKVKECNIHDSVNYNFIEKFDKLIDKIMCDNK